MLKRRGMKRGGDVNGKGDGQTVVSLVAVHAQ